MVGLRDEHDWMDSIGWTGMLLDGILNEIGAAAAPEFVHGSSPPTTGLVL